MIEDDELKAKLINIESIEKLKTVAEHENKEVSTWATIKKMVHQFAQETSWRELIPLSVVKLIAKFVLDWLVSKNIKFDFTTEDIAREFIKSDLEYEFDSDLDDLMSFDASAPTGYGSSIPFDPIDAAISKVMKRRGAGYSPTGYPYNYPQYPQQSSYPQAPKYPEYSPSTTSHSVAQKKLMDKRARQVAAAAGRKTRVTIPMTPRNQKIILNDMLDELQDDQMRKQYDLSTLDLKYERY